MSFILMESKWSRLKMILTVPCGNDCYQCHIPWLGRCRWHSTWSFSGSVFQRLWSSWCYPESARAIRHCRSDLCCVLRQHQFYSNNSVFSGAIVLLCTILNTPLLWFPCKRHMLAVNISHFMGPSLERRPRPPGGLCVKLQKVWPTVKNEIENSLGWITLVQNCQWSSAVWEKSPTLEYKKLCELFVGLDKPVFHYHQPGPCH